MPNKFLKYYDPSNVVSTRDGDPESVIRSQVARTNADLNRRYEIRKARNSVSRILIVLAFLAFFVGAFLGKADDPLALPIGLSFFPLLIVAWVIGR